MKIKKLLLGSLAGLMTLTLTGAAPGAGSGAIAMYTGDGTVGARGLSDAVEPLFASDREDPIGETRALIVVHDGEIVAERYGDGFGPDSRMLGWSVSKTVTALLVGLMVSDGRLALDEPVPIPAWHQSGDPRGAITLRQMLNMASGIQHRERGEPLEDSDTLRMFVGDGAADQAGYEEAKPLASHPGAEFNYDTGTTVALCDMLTRLLTDSDKPEDRRMAMLRFVRQRLALPAGMTSLVPEFDARGTMLGGAMMHMTARDYARLGELLRHDGTTESHSQILSPRWIKFMRRSSPANAGYGGHIWLNRHGAERDMFVGRAPGNMFAAVGLRGQYVIVSPSQHLTIVRLGVTADEDLPALREALATILDRYPSS